MYLLLREMYIDRNGQPCGVACRCCCSCCRCCDVYSTGPRVKCVIPVTCGVVWCVTRMILVIYHLCDESYIMFWVSKYCSIYRNSCSYRVQWFDIFPIFSVLVMQASVKIWSDYIVLGTDMVMRMLMFMSMTMLLEALKIHTARREFLGECSGSLLM